MLELQMNWRLGVNLTLIVVLMSLALQLQAEVYQWVDEQGRVHFSDRPNEDGSTGIKIKEQQDAPTSDGPSERQQKMQRMLDVYAEERAEREEAKQKQQAELKKRKQYCARAKDRYNSHTRATGIYNLGSDGERRYLSEEERARHIKQLKSDIARWCK
jgi:2-polyprenyl-6-methoxyphenol hydroxylase-like FAD-dependent oxidoreductase